MEPAGIGGARRFTPAVHRDDRGHFPEWSRAGELPDSPGYWPQTAQASCPASRRGVIRGAHFAAVPPGQAKYVTCLSGAVLDVIVDIRAGSPAYGRREAVRLDDTSRRAAFLEAGLGSMLSSTRLTTSPAPSSPATPNWSGPGTSVSVTDIAFHVIVQPEHLRRKNQRRYAEVVRSAVA